MQPETNGTNQGQGQLPQNPQQPVVNPPAFHNPLAQGYTEKTAQLPDITTTQPPDSTSGVANPSSVAAPDSASVPPQLPMGAEQQQSVVQPTVPASEPPQSAPAAQSELDAIDVDTPLIPDPAPIAPAPVRLAPEAGSTITPLASSNVPPHIAARATHNSASVSATSQPLGKSNVPRKRPLRAIIMIIVLLALIGGGGYAGWSIYSARFTSPTPTQSAALSSVRDTSVKELASGYERLETGCYSIQIPTQPRVDINKDCQLSVFYGTQKVSSVVVSTFRDFDFVAQDSEQASASPDTKRFDSKRVMEALITNATTGKSISARQDIKIGNIDAVKIVGAAQAGGDPVYVNVFIVLPESDQQFAERNFIALTITGAYNDSYSRKTFDHVLETWTWK